MTSLETRLNKLSTILECYEDGGPHARLVDECRPPEPANMRQLQDVVQAVSGAWRRDKLEDLEEGFNGDPVDRTLRSRGLGPTRMSGCGVVVICDPIPTLTCAVFTATHVSIVANGSWKPRPTLKFDAVTPAAEGIIGRGRGERRSDAKF